MGLTLSQLYRYHPTQVGTTNSGTGTFTAVPLPPNTGRDNRQWDWDCHNCTAPTQHRKGQQTVGLELSQLYRSHPTQDGTTNSWTGTVTAVPLPPNTGRDNKQLDWDCHSCTAPTQHRTGQQTVGLTQLYRFL